MTHPIFKRAIDKPCRQWLGLLLITLAGSVQATNDLERQMLSQLLAELQVFEPIIKVSEQSATPNDRQAFDYAALRRDIELIIQGVSDHLSMKRRDPNALPALRGEYRQ